MQTIDQPMRALLNGINASLKTEETSKTGQELQPSKGCGTLALSSHPEGQKQLAKRLYDEFHAMKTYGKEPESLQSIIPLFATALAKYPIDLVMKAFDTHAARCQEFPTRFDIVNLIERNGKPPMSKELYINISKKSPEFRNANEWEYMREYEKQQRGDDWETSYAEDSKANLVADNERLRKLNGELKAEIKRLNALVIAQRIAP